MAAFTLTQFRYGLPLPTLRRGNDFRQRYIPIFTRQQINPLAVMSNANRVGLITLPVL